jgi:predicted thioesterase
MRPDDEVPDNPSPVDGATSPVDAQAGPAVGRAHVSGDRGGALDATASWVGAVIRVQLTVTDADTAQAVGSGDVPVLGMPRVLALVEAATVGATANRLPAGAATVGTRVELDHHAPTRVGGTVVAEARLAKADGRRLTFEVIVRDGDAVVAEGRVDRIVVDRRRFVQKAFGEAAS